MAISESVLAGNGARKLVGALVDPELKRRLAEQAAANERSVSQELRLMLRNHLPAERGDARQRLEA